FSGVIFCFRAKRADRVKLIFWDGTGLCLFAKRLEGGKFRWPRIEDGVMRLSAAQLAALIEGLDWMRVRARLVPTPEAVRESSVKWIRGEVLSWGSPAVCCALGVGPPI